MATHTFNNAGNLTLIEAYSLYSCDEFFCLCESGTVIRGLLVLLTGFTMTFSGSIEFILYKPINKANSMPTFKPFKTLYFKDFPSFYLIRYELGFPK